MKNKISLFFPTLVIVFLFNTISVQATVYPYYLNIRNDAIFLPITGEEKIYQGDTIDLKKLAIKELPKDYELIEVTTKEQINTQEVKQSQLNCQMTLRSKLSGQIEQKSIQLDVTVHPLISLKTMNYKIRLGTRFNSYQCLVEAKNNKTDQDLTNQVKANAISTNIAGKQTIEFYVSTQNNRKEFSQTTQETINILPYKQEVKYNRFIQTKNPIIWKEV
ncbi:MAG: hypothetical protein LBV67_01380, partial [Streptococcaceae bacterium]|nr:hypothetical protein [Streptococcaceae bacterium]